MAAWYLAADDELLIDLDGALRPTKNGAPWIEEFFRKRLRNAVADKLLALRADRPVWLVRSATPGHYHAFVRLYDTMCAGERFTWQLHLGSDLYRGRADLMRLWRGKAAPSLLIEPEPIERFYRPPDYLCACTGKHKIEEQLAAGRNACPVWLKVRGLSPYELFGRPSNEPEQVVPLPMDGGEVPMALVMERRTAAAIGNARKRTGATRPKRK